MGMNMRDRGDWVIVARVGREGQRRDRDEGGVDERQGGRSKWSVLPGCVGVSVLRMRPEKYRRCE